MRTRIFENIGRSVIVVHDGIELHGQEKGGVLFTETGPVIIPQDATITEHKPPITVNKKTYKATADTPFEYFQQQRYGNIIKEDTDIETHDDLKQWHYD